jgi:formylglycine-generating enzyme required for sulfatase activity
MAVLFISHSRKDDAAGALEAWLYGHGFTDVFVDHSTIASEKWAQALREASGVCRVVMCLVTERWLASDECFAEFKAAWYLGKRIIPLLALGPGEACSSERLAYVLAEGQGIDVAACMDGEGRLDLARDSEIERRLEAELRAAGALAKIGLDPEAFAIDRKLRRTPFPGLASFGDEDADAALFYGRSREIAEALEELRKMRAERDLRPFVILGVWGAGKSSLLKAGIIPRLRREAPAWLPLRAFRPGADPLLNFAEAIARSLADYGKVEAHGPLRDRLFDAWSKAERASEELTPAGLAAIETLLEAEGRKLRESAGRPAATILVSVDEAEEMARAESDSGEALSDYLRAALVATASHWQLACTIGTASFSELQNHRRFRGLKARGYDLRVLPALRFDSVVEEPAKRYGVAVDDRLVDALIEDAPEKDALPLLAFGLQRLWRQYAASGALTKLNCDTVGGLKGLIEDAAERALRGFGPDEDVALPSGPPTKARVDLAASAFVPALAQINEQGATILRVAAWNSFSDEQQDLLIRFEQWRLVVRKGEADGRTVEVAHQALLREWSRLKGWLEPERERLDELRALQTDALTWDRNGRNAAFLNHRDQRLAEAAALTEVEAYRKRLGRMEFAYLAACQAAARLTRRRTWRIRALVGVMAFVVVAVLVGWRNASYIQEHVHLFTTVRRYTLANVRPYVLTAEAERALRSEASFRECAADCPEMIVVPAGSFMMGSPVTEQGRSDDEGPQHEVTIAKPFAVSKFDVTFADWDACVSVGECPEVSDDGMGQGTKPVIDVTWDEAQAYIAWFSWITRKPYRLLTEAEWEYAARAGTTTAYPWGNEIAKGNANCAGCGGQWDSKETSPVGSFKPNAFGLFDTVGNAWQWVEDCYHDSYNGAPADGSAWTTGDCKARVVRGGSWVDLPQGLRSAGRFAIASYSRFPNLGFRVARTLTP